MRRYYRTIFFACLLIGLCLLPTPLFASEAPIDTTVRLKYKGTSVPCLIPSGISQKEIEILKYALPLEFPMGGRLHCLVYGLNYGMIRVYVVEYWDNHLQYMEVVLLEYVIPGQESKFWVHLWRPELGFMLLRPITHERWKEITFYFIWGEGSK